MRLEFSIPLWNLDFNPELDFDPTIFAYELSADSLAEMWDLYGRDDFLAELGIEVIYFSIDFELDYSNLFN